MHEMSGYHGRSFLISIITEAEKGMGVRDGG